MVHLNQFVSQDARIRSVYDWARGEYAKAGLLQHNWSHVLRDLWRALKIAEAEHDVDYSILIPAVLLHDIGATPKQMDYTQYRSHAAKGAQIVKSQLPKFAYTEKEIAAISHCVQTHGGNPMPQSQEARILADADRLEKPGIGGMMYQYLSFKELGYPIDFWLKRNLHNYSNWAQKTPFFTKKARHMAGNGFKQVLNHLKQVDKGLKARPDFLVEEQDFWD